MLFDEKCEFGMNFNLGIGRFKGNFSGEFKGKKGFMYNPSKILEKLATLFFQIKSLISSHDFHEFSS